MRDLWDNGILQRILVLLVLTALLGISPLPHAAGLEFERARRALDFAAPAEAAAHLARLAELLPWRVDLWEKAGLSALQGDDFEAAVLYFKEAAARGMLSRAGYLAFGDAYLDDGNPYTAVQIWQAAEHIFGPSADSTLRIAAIHRNAKEYPALIEDLKSLINLQRSTTTEQALIGIYRELGFLLAAYDPESAPPYLLQTFELNPAFTDARELSFAIQRALPEDNPAYTWMASGQKLADLGEWELAALAFRHAAEEQPEHAEAWAYLGEALQHLAAPLAKNALPTLEKAIELDPDSLPANTFLALYWQRQGAPEKTLAYLAAAADLDPRNPNIQADLGAAEAVLGDLESAESHYKQAVELSAHQPAYLNRLAEFYLRYNLDIRARVLPLARQTLLLYPDDPACLDVMGEVFFRLNDLHSAERFYSKAIARQPGYAPAYLHLGILYNLQGNRTLAENYLNQAIALAPGTATADHAQRVLEDFSNP